MSEMKKCPVCAGTGRENDGDAWQQTSCCACDGTGQVPETVASRPCPFCGVQIEEWAEVCAECADAALERVKEWAQAKSRDAYPSIGEIEVM